jgi:nitroreductase
MTTAPPSRIEQILGAARWAPSGDNTQPWRFEILDEHRFLVHGHDTRDWCVYDLDGRASQLAIGALLENIVIAASPLALMPKISRQPTDDESRTTFDVRIADDPGIATDELFPFLEQRVTQRRPLSRTALSDNQKAALLDAMGPGYSLRWVDDRASVRRMAGLLSRSARLRLTIPEGFEVHRRIIDWGVETSDDKIPAPAVGLDPVGIALMRWAMQSWRRVDTLNTYFAGTWLPRLQLDLLPGLFCGAHFMIVGNDPLDSIDRTVAGGRAMQRLWLKATQLGLQFQPEMTPLIFSRYGAEGRRFSTRQTDTEVSKISDGLQGVFGLDGFGHCVFMGRLGFGAAPRSRSVRLDLQRLMTSR